ncbi:MAG: DUF2779 domain-containing protein [Candidatus Hydrogenedentes bacterium]|nr:DUF2779 domain-containing protein [Candidatus Hydrogenedentota bacterium]
MSARKPASPAPQRQYRLSKSRLLSFLQCPKRLHLALHRPDLAEEDEGAARRMAAGHGVGDIARSLHPGGVLIGHDDNLVAALAETAERVNASPRAPLFEATFEHEGVLARADLMLPQGRGWRMVEVKSSASVKDYHLRDCAIQTWVARHAGIRVHSVAVAHVDTAFVYPGGGNYGGLLKEVDVDDDIEALASEVPGWVSEAKAVLAGPEPAIPVGDQCEDPFPCPFHAHCSRDLPPGPEYPVELLPGVAGKRLAAALRASGIDDLRDAPEERFENDQFRRIWQATASGEAFLDPAATKELKRLGWPRHYLDFESVQFAVPIWADTRPYQQVVFQWSCHTESQNGKVMHREFLETGGGDPQRHFAESLLAALDDDGPVFVYNQSFEATRLKELADLFTDLAEKLKRIVGRMVDLLPITRRHYYHPEMKGSWSIKAVLPTVDGELSYDGLDTVAHGQEAQAAYLELMAPGIPDERKAELERGLLEYCRRDTLALLKLCRMLSQEKWPR